MINLEQSLASARRDFERTYFERLLTKHDWRVAVVARVAQVDRCALYGKLRKLGLL